ncbi:MAG TPA: DUF2239 family protein [bacterium]|nr:DUF2239 family protein [bacterium]
MSPDKSNSFTCFDGNRRVATGPLQAIALTLKEVRSSGTTNSVLVFDNSTGRTIDIDTRGTDDEVLTRLADSVAPSGPYTPMHPDTSPSAPPSEPPSNEGRGRGRPKLGVVPREVTLLPRHWEWLGAQPGGASVALRKLVEEARRAGSERDSIRKAHERAYHFMSAIAGDLPGFEEATRALFARDPNRFSDLVASWPADVRDHAVLLGFRTEPYANPTNE